MDRRSGLLLGIAERAAELLILLVVAVAYLFMLNFTGLAVARVRGQYDQGPISSPLCEWYFP